MLDGEVLMIAPIAAIIFASAMALSLSVEADSFFHTPTTAAPAPDEAQAPAPDTSDTVDTSPDSAGHRR
jgi:hypothetical protein